MSHRQIPPPAQLDEGENSFSAVETSKVCKEKEYYKNKHFHNCQTLITKNSMTQRLH